MTIGRPAAQRPRSTRLADAAKQLARAEAQVERRRVARDHEIIAHALDGWSLRDIAANVGLTAAQVHRIVRPHMEPHD